MASCSRGTVAMPDSLVGFGRSEVQGPTQADLQRDQQGGQAGWIQPHDERNISMDLRTASARAGVKPGSSDVVRLCGCGCWSGGGE